ncbi:MAG: BrnT family toxin [Roseiarcus sp.]
MPDIRQRRSTVNLRYAFDPAKDAVNRAKHGVSLALGEVPFARPYVSIADDRFDYGETRQVAFGVINDRLFACVYVDRNGERRIISLRKANQREARRYGQDVE